jgi:hypothetical protein
MSKRVAKCVICDVLVPTGRSLFGLHLVPQLLFAPVEEINKRRATYSLPPIEASEKKSLVSR